MKFKQDWLPIVIIFVAAGLIRAIPEIKMGSWPIGYDTFNAYAPDILKFNGNFLQWLFSANLLYFLLWPFYKIFQVDPNLLVKIFGSLLYGLLSVAMYAFTRKSLKWSVFWSVLVGLLFMIQLPALRMSWDLLRNLLALILLLPAMYLLDNRSKLYHGLFLLLFSILIIVSNQLVASLWFFIIIAYLARDLIKKNWLDVTQLAVAIIPSIFIYYIVLHTSASNSFSGHAFYRGEADRIFNYFQAYTSTTSYQELTDLITSFFYLNYQYILPLVLVGMWVLRKNFGLVIMSIFLLFGTFSSLILDGYGLFVWTRWLWMLVVPFTVFAVAALKWGSESLFNLPIFQNRYLRFSAMATGILLILFYLGSISTVNYPFLTSPQDKAKMPFNDPKFTGLMPSTMLWNAVGYKNEKELMKILDYCNQNLPKNAVLMIDNRYRGFVLTHFDYSSRYVVTYPWSTNLNEKVMNEFKDKKIGPIYTIWSIHTAKNNDFELIYRAGNDGVYREKETNEYFQTL